MAIEHKSGFIRETIKVILELIFGPKAARYVGAVTVLVIILVVVLIVGGIGAGIQSYRNNQSARKDAKNKDDILRDKGKIEIIGENRNAQIEINTEAAKESEKASANFSDVLRTDSSKRDGNFSSARRKWCEDHSGDSKCR